MLATIPSLSAMTCAMAFRRCTSENICDFNHEDRKSAEDQEIRFDPFFRRHATRNDDRSWDVVNGRSEKGGDSVEELRISMSEM